ncbi:MAG: YcbK family protein [Verrucomicrobium sp.]
MDSNPPYKRPLPPAPKPPASKILFHDEWVPNRRRRRIAAALAGTMGGALLGALGYPWVAGDRREELIALWNQSKIEPKKVASNLVRKVRDDAGETPYRPMILDATGIAYEAFLNGLRLRNISAREILLPHFKTRSGVNNELPGRHLWQNMVATLRVADQLRDELGVKLVTIASAYRSPAYNAACPGAASHSFHMQNLALDLVYDCSPSQVAEAANALRNRGAFKGGIGRYGTFTHIDTRGKNTNWG